MQMTELKDIAGGALMENNNTEDTVIDYRKVKKA